MATLASPAAPGARLGKALWDYEAIEDNELTFKAGDLVEIIELCNDDWYEGRFTGKTGYFPANRVQLLVEPLAENAAAVPSAVGNAQNAVGQPPPIQSPEKKRPASQYDAKSPVGSMPSAGAQLPPGSPQRRSPDPFTDAPSDGAKENAPDASSVRSTVKTPEASGENVSPTSGGEGSDSGMVLVGNEEVGEPLDYIEEDDLEVIDDWRTVTNADGTCYYWNITTGDTAWELPGDLEPVPLEEDEHPGYEFDTTYYSQGYAGGRPRSRADSTGSAEMLGIQTPTEEDLRGDDLAQQISEVPPEIVRLEGWLSVKKGKETKRIASWTSWQNYYGVLCVGFLVLYKDELAKLRKKSDRVSPACVIRLNTVVVEMGRKEQSKKKNSFSVCLDDGSQWMLVPVVESDANSWMDSIKEASKERSTANEYENATSKLFDRTRSEEPRSKGKDDPPSRKPTANKDKRTERSLSVSINEVDDSEDKSKAKVKNKLGAFFSKRPPAEKLKEKGILLEVNQPAAADMVFGGSLEAQVQREGKSIPTIVEQCIAEVDKRGLQSVGIYRLSGNAATIQKIKAQFNAREYLLALLRLDRSESLFCFAS